MGAIVEASFLNPLDRSSQLVQGHNWTAYPGTLGLGPTKKWVGFLLGPNGGLGHRTSETSDGGATWQDVNTVYGNSWYDPNSTGIGASYQIRIVDINGQFVDKEGLVNSAWISLSGSEPTIIKVKMGDIWYAYFRRVGQNAAASRLALWAPSS